MSDRSLVTRRQVIGEAGAAAAAIALPSFGKVVSGAAASSKDAPHLPLLILDREGLIAEHGEAIRKISDQVTITRDGGSIADAQVIFGNVGEAEFSKCAKLKWVQFPAAGVEGILWPEFVTSDVVLTNAQGCYAPQIAEHAFGLLFALTRGIASQARSRKFGFDGEPIEMRGMTMGIIGLGGIGREVARRAKAMDMRVIAVDAEPMYANRFAMVDDVRLVDDGLMEMLKQADVVVMASPHTVKSRGMLGPEQFAAMKRGAYFINVSRGKTVKTDALVAALNDARLAGAGLDVTDPEPLPADHVLWGMANVVITSHIAGRSQLGRGRVHGVFAENVRRYVAGLSLLNVVDKWKGY